MGCVFHDVAKCQNKSASPRESENYKILNGIILEEIIQNCNSSRSNISRIFQLSASPNVWGFVFQGSEQTFIIQRGYEILGNFPNVCIKIINKLLKTIPQIFERMQIFNFLRTVWGKKELFYPEAI